jgi:ATP-binding cassette subfamily B (MDR/TAP) protein 1
MLDGEDYEHKKYFSLLQDAANKTMKYDLGVGIAIGLLWAASLWSYALGFWYGAKLIADQVSIILI